MAAISDLHSLLQSMEPVLNAGVFVFASVESSTTLDIGNAIAFVREPEGLSVVFEESEARRRGLSAESRFAWITLSVNSDLQAVGLTAAFSSALGRAGISCNVVAGANHDHIFVPVEKAVAAMTKLTELQQIAAQVASRAE